ncbi:J domain-containing protein [Pseudobacillus badius]|uniref:J domain-containing protein n=1 Tax=Bacillus badius TaxID=1455 RepID=UPI0024A31C8F|nr:J domain-containing protein [Bacillus badius]GLY10830.1 hypothetical protein Bbad01_20460 [Bacillus badius]
MTAWDILEIEPTEELSAIKKAYARKLKVHHPEEDPAGYQRLREAYDWAVKYQKTAVKRASVPVEAGVRAEEGNGWAASYDEAEEYDIGGNDQAEAAVEMDNHAEADVHIPTPPPVDWRDYQDPFRRNEKLIDEFMNRVEELYENFAERIDIEAWTALLDSDVIWNFELKREASERLLAFLEDYPFLPKSIWQLLDSNFQWSQEAFDEDHPFWDYASDRFSEYFQHQVKPYYPGLSYSFLLRAKNIDFDAYLYCRECALQHLIVNEMEQAEEWLHKAEAIFTGDPELLRLKGSVYLHTGRLERASEALGQATQINPDDIEARMMLAYTLYESKQLPEAIQQCKIILDAKPDHIDTLSIYGKSLFEQNQLAESRNIFKRIEEMEPNASEAVTYLAAIHVRMIKELPANERPPLSELNKELQKPGAGKQLLLFLGRLPKIKMMFLFALMAYSWHVFTDMVYLNPFEFVLVIVFSFFVEEISASFFGFWSCIWLLFFAWIFRKFIREIRKAWRAARY